MDISESEECSEIVRDENGIEKDTYCYNKAAKEDIHPTEPDEKREEKWWKCEKMDDPENDSLFSQKAERNKRNEPRYPTQEDCSFPGKHEKLTECFVSGEKKEGYAWYENKQRNNRFSEEKPEEDGEIEDVVLEKMYEQIIRMKENHSENGYPTGGVQFFRTHKTVDYGLLSFFV